MQRVQPESYAGHRVSSEASVRISAMHKAGSQLSTSKPRDAFEIMTPLSQQVRATFCVGNNSGDGLDDVFCPQRRPVPTRLTLAVKVGPSNATVFGLSGPWPDGSRQIFEQVQRTPYCSCRIHKGLGPLLVKCKDECTSIWLSSVLLAGSWDQCLASRRCSRGVVHHDRRLRLRPLEC